MANASRNSTLADRDDVAAPWTGVELARSADLLVGVGNHLRPLRDPTHGAGEREDAGEHAGWDAERALHDAGVEVHIRVELAIDEVLILERDLFQVHRQLEKSVVVQPELVQDFVASLAHQLRTRIVVFVDAVTEAHQPKAGVLVLRLLYVLVHPRDI